MGSDQASLLRGQQSGLAASILTSAADDLAPFVEPTINYLPTGGLGLASLVVANAATSAAQQIQWPCDGYVVGIRAQSQDAVAASMAGLRLRVLVDGTTDLFTTGTGNFLIPFAMLSGTSLSSVYRTRVTFRQGVAWQVFVQNTTSGSLTCDVVFDYVNVSTPRS